VQRTNIYLDERQLRTLKHIAAEKRSSVATLVREAVDAYLDRQRAEDRAWMETVDELWRGIREHSADVPPDEIEAEISAAREEVREMRRARRAAGGR
jgi:predicted transcriptional regulator